MSDSSSFVLANSAVGFGAHGPEDDDLHAPMNAAVESYALTETQYFGFSAPEHRIHGIGYFWHHPRLNCITGGVAAWQGQKALQSGAELHDMRSFMSDAPVRKGLGRFQMDNRYEVEVIEPLERIRIKYHDPARGNALDILYTAVSAPMMLPNRKHFEQVMRTQGTLTLRGKTVRINGYNIRDRSWAEARSEMPMASPPVAWMTGVFGDDFAFNCCCTEDPDANVEWKDIYPEHTAAAALKGGWILRDQRRQRLIKARSVIERDAHLHPSHITLQLTGEDGVTHEVRGTVRSSCPVSLWPNVFVPVCLTEWHWDGRTGWGDTQDCQWPDFVHYALANRSTGTGQ
ncbi:MAG: hypothetical protein ABW110_05380 [Steroidobacteraceae bacterium]